MKDVKYLGLILIFLLLLSACKKEEKSPTFTFSALGLEVSGLREKTPVRVFHEGKLVLSYPAFPSRNVFLVFPWEPGGRYLVLCGKRKFWLTAPPQRPLAEVKIFAPLGSPGKRLVLFPGQKVEEELVLFSRKECPEIGLLFTSNVKGLSLVLPAQKKALGGELSRYFYRQRICLKEGKPLPFTLRLEPEDQKPGVEIVLRLKRKNFSLSREVKLLSWLFPTDETGYTLRVRREGLLVLPNPLFERLGYFLGLKAQGFSRYDPLAYETITLINTGPAPVNVLVKADFFEAETGKPATGFYPPRFGMAGHYRKPLALAYLPPGEKVKVVLPVYAHELKPGSYLARVSLFSFGEEEPFLVKERLIGVTRGSPLLSGALLLILLLGGGFSVLVFLRLKALLRRFSLRELTLLALAGAVAFGLDFLGGMLANVLYALLGPFNILVGGLITEVVHYMVFAALLVLVPRPGFATLKGLLHYLMGLVLFGGVRATDPFFLGFSLLTFELALLVFGAYRRPLSWRTVFSLALADAVNTASSLVLHMTFYRLFFPGWYLALDVVVKGFLYTLLGAWIGLRVGRHLGGFER